MTKEEAWNRIDAIIAKHEIDDEYVTITSLLDYDALRLARELLEQEPCDAVSKEAVLNGIFEDEYIKDHINGDVWERIEGIVDELPSVTPAEKVGHWEYVQYDGNPNIGNWHCSECNRIVCGAIKAANPVYAYKYCPACGAKMQEVES